MPIDLSHIEAMLSAQEVAEILSITKRTVWRWAAEGILPQPHKLSRRTVRWKASELQRFMDEKKNVA